MSTSNTTKVYSRWTREDKIKLLHGLKVYGYRDIHNIAKLIPNKSMGAIRTMIYKYSMAAKDACKSENPLDDWIQLNYFKGDNSMVPEALLYISMFEEQPSPVETGGIDVRAFYEMMYRACTNQPLPELTSKEHETLVHLHEVLNLKISPSTESEVLEFLNSINNPPEQIPRKVYNRKQR